MQAKRTYPLTDFATHAREHLSRLKATGELETLTVDGETTLIVQDAEAYQRLLDRLDALETVAAVRESATEYGRGDDLSAREGMDSLRGKYGIPRRS